MPMQQSLSATELMDLLLEGFNKSALGENNGQTSGIVDMTWRGTGAPPSFTASRWGEVTLMPAKNGKLLIRSVLVPITSCLATAEHWI